MRYGLIGERLGHSCSPRIHALLGNGDYVKRPVARGELEGFIAGRDFDGLNVTIPYKKAVIPLLDTLSPAAARIGAVNVIVKNADGSLSGHNTDYDGFLKAAEEAGADFAGSSVTILGSGGTSDMVRTAAEDSGAREINIVSRSGRINYANLGTLKGTEVLVNTTPVGMFPDVDGCLTDIRLFPNLRCVIDVVFNPLRTELVRRALDAGIPAVGGLPMLVMQAIRSHELFFGVRISGEKYSSVLRQMQEYLSNVVLIGMPGCGKTTVGRRTAQRLGKRFEDTDESVRASAGAAPGDIIKLKGEEYFRELESAAVAAAAAQSGTVIACGGGVVKRAENMRRLARNGRIVYIRRDTGLLDRRGRPLSEGDGALDALYAERAPLYERYSDIVIINDGSVGQAVDDIVRALGFDEEVCDNGGAT